MASKPLTRDFSASSSEDDGTSDLFVAADFAVPAGVEVGSLFNFLGFFFCVFDAAAVTSSVLGATTAFLDDDAETFAEESFGKTTPPADPALPCSDWLGVAAFLDRACLIGVAGVALGSGDDGLTAIVSNRLLLSEHVKP